VRVVLITPPPVDSDKWEGRSDEHVADYANAVRVLAAADDDCVVVDLWEDLPDSPRCTLLSVTQPIRLSHSLTTHSLTHSLTTHSLVHSLTRTLSHPQCCQGRSVGRTALWPHRPCQGLNTHSYTLIHTYIHTYIHIHTFTPHSNTHLAHTHIHALHSTTHSLAHTLTHSHTHALTHSHTHALTPKPQVFSKLQSAMATAFPDIDPTWRADGSCAMDQHYPDWRAMVGKNR